MSTSRRACDRCHGQKIRCPRNSDNNQDSCTRCLNAGTLCVYSPALPTGRPITSQLTTGKNVGSTTTHSSVGSDILMDLNSWTPVDALDQSHHLMDFGNDLSWDQSLSEFTNEFDPSVPAELPTASRSEYGSVSTSSLPVTLPPQTGSVPQPLKSPPYTSRHPNLCLSVAADTSELCIRRLSDLSIRLYPVYTTSRLLAVTQRERPGKLSSTAAFETVAAFVRGVSDGDTAGRGCNVLHEIFFAARSMLEILDQLRTNATISDGRHHNTKSAPGVVNTKNRSDISLLSRAFTTPSQSASSSSSLSSVLESENTQAPLSPPAASPSPPCEDSDPDGVIFHLILACYIRLLHIYRTLIVTLRRDSRYYKDIGSGTLSSFELQLVLFVQLVTHLLERLSKAIRVYRSSVTDISEALTAMAKTDDIFPLEKSLREELKKLQKGLLSSL